MAREDGGGGNESPGAGEPVGAPADDLLAIVEALLFATGEVVTLDRLVHGLPRVGRRRIREAVEQLAQRYREEGRAFDVVEIAGGWRLMTRPEFYPFLARMVRGREMERLSPAALETLAIVAYRQPVTRGGVEGIRGVQADAVLRTLLERRLIRVVGRAEVIGRPRLYGTTKRFLDLFGLAGLEDLPAVDTDPEHVPAEMAEDGEGSPVGGSGAGPREGPVGSIRPDGEAGPGGTAEEPPDATAVEDS